MKRITNVKRAASRGYHSKLRDERAEDTRQRILDALVRTIARGVAGLSIPAVAAEAGVSVPTVYRYFKTKSDLVAALGPFLHEKSRLMQTPDTSHGVGEMVREIYQRHAALTPEVRAAMASELGGEVRRQAMPRRMAVIRDSLRAFVPGASSDDLERLTRVALIFMATPTIRAFEEYLGKAPGEAADDVGWVMETLVGSLRRKRT